MKKIYALLGLATALTATAAVPSQQKQLVPATSQLENVEVNFTAVENSDMMKAPAVGYFNNYYGLDYYGMTTQDNSEQLGAVELRKISDTEVNIYGLGVFGDYPVKATYDASAQTLTVKKQVYMSAAEFASIGGSNEPVYLYVTTSNQATGNMDEISEIVFKYCPYGVTFSDGSTGYEGGWVVMEGNRIFCFNTASNFNAQSGGSMSGWVGSWKYAVALPQLSDFYPEAGAFIFDESEWTSTGTSKLEDGWFLSEGAFNVATYQSKSNPNEYLLLKPFASVADNDTPNADGYLILNIENPGCVVVKPHVMSGYTSAEQGMMASVATTTREGVSYYLNEYTFDEIIEEAELYDDPLPVMEGNVITLPNCIFQNVPNFEPEDINYWVNSNREPIPMISKITLATGAGVNGIINDADNAATRYFNLQGVEIAQPAAGEVVIVKEGNKTSKTIVR
ncbi:MAG: hypothetical protein HDR84_00130 [Bacteroides sp.]|nr:hypothetical protein [Bacteroides sp.]